MSDDIARIGLAVDSRDVVSATTDLKKFDSTAAKADGTASRLSRTAGTLSRSFSGLRGMLAGAFAAASVGSIFKATAALDGVHRALTVIRGSSDAANQELRYIAATADRLGQNIGDTRDTYTSFIAATKGTALEGEKSRVIFESVANAMGVLGRSSDDTKGALLALQQMVSKGVVSSEELSGQLGERLPGAFAAAARAMGKNEQQLRKMLETGKVVAADLLPKLAVELNKMYNGGQRIEGLTASWNRFGNAITVLTENIGRELQDNVIKQIDSVTDAIKWMSERGISYIKALKAEFANLVPASVTTAVDAMDLGGNTARELATFKAAFSEVSTIVSGLKAVWNTTITEGGEAGAKAGIAFIASFQDRMNGIENTDLSALDRLVVTINKRVNDALDFKFRMQEHEEVPSLIPTAKRPSAPTGTGTPTAKKTNPYEQEIKSLEAKTLAYEDERVKIGLTTEAAAYYQAMMDQLRKADEAKIAITPQVMAAIDARAAAYGRAAKAADEAQKKFEATNAAATGIGQSLNQAFDSAVIEGEKLKDVASSLLKSFASMLTQAAFTGSGPMAGLLGTAPTTAGGAGGLSSMFAGLFADGGTMGRGKFGIVGERGPEIVSAGSSPLTITPLRNANDNGSAGGGAQFQNNFYAQGADRNELERLRLTVERNQAQVNRDFAKNMRRANERKSVRSGR